MHEGIVKSEIKQKMVTQILRIILSIFSSIFSMKATKQCLLNIHISITNKINTIIISDHMVFK